MSRSRLCWPCVATMAAALIAGATAFAVTQQQPTRAAAVSTVSTPPTAGIDVSDAEVRDLLALVIRPERNRGADLPETLYQRCRTGLEDSYAATRAYSFEEATYAELRRGNDGTWTALAWQNKVVGIPPRPPPPPGCNTPECLAKPGASKQWQRTVSDSDVAFFLHEFRNVSRDATDPVRGTLYVLDGGTLVVESCVGGRYGLFVRANALNDDLSIHGLADQLLAFAGVTEADLGSGSP
jgi:hypothetical protein